MSDHPCVCGHSAIVHDEYDVRGRSRYPCQASNCKCDDFTAPAAAPSLPAGAGEPNVIEPDPYCWLRSLSLVPMSEGSFLYFSTRHQAESRAALAELAAREQRIGELTRQMAHETNMVEEVGNARDLYHTRTVNLLGQVERLASELASREARIGELEKENDALRSRL